jgi:hypothetical protein
MNYRIVDVFRGVDREKFMKLFFDPEFNEQVKKGVPVRERQEIKREDDGKVLRSTMRVVPARQIPEGARKILGADTASYEEDSVYRHGSYVVEWKVRWSFLPGKIRHEGTMKLFEEGKDAVRREISGDLKVSLFGVGGLVEKTIVEGIEESYKQATSFTQRWIDEHLRG